MVEDANARYSSLPKSNENRVTPAKGGFNDQTADLIEESEFRPLSDEEIDRADLKQTIIWIAQSSTSDRRHAEASKL